MFFKWHLLYSFNLTSQTHLFKNFVFACFQDAALLYKTLIIRSETPCWEVQTNMCSIVADMHHHHLAICGIIQHHFQCVILFILLVDTIGTKLFSPVWGSVYNNFMEMVHVQAFAILSHINLVFPPRIF